MQFKKKFKQEQSLVGSKQDSEGLKEGFEGLEQGSANYLGSNRILQGSWLHGPPSLIGRGEEGQPQEFLIQATFSPFSRPSHLEILVPNPYRIIKPS